MAHSLYVGMTESGKTTLAKFHASQFQQDNTLTMVLDPMRDPGWNANYQTTDQDEFSQTFWASRECAVFIDEAGDVDYSEEMTQTATKGRHLGHACHYITQRQTSVKKTVRDQCRYLFCFALSFDDRVILSKDFNAPLLRDCNDLKAGEFVMCDKFGYFKRMRIF